MVRKKILYFQADYIYKIEHEKKFKNESGVSLIELLVGVAVTALMMGAMFATYNVVSSSYDRFSTKPQSAHLAEI